MLGLCLSGSSWALEARMATGPVTIEAASVSYDREHDAYQAQGEVSITFSGGTLQADSVVLERGANMATAVGHVVLRTDNDVLEGEKVVYNITANTGIVYAGKMFIARNHFYLQGDKIEKTGEATYSVQEASLTTCDGAAPDWRITGRQLNVTVDGYGLIKDGKFFAKDVPVLYVPYLIFPAKTSRQTGFLFPYTAYSSDKLGWDAELPFFLAISSDADATFYSRYMDKRGFKEGVEFRYLRNSNSYGTIYADYLQDSARITEQKDNLSRNWQTSQNRWSYYLQNFALLKPGLYLRSDIAGVSDPWYFKDFTAHNYYLDHYAVKADERFRKVSFTADESLNALESKVRLVKDWPLYNLTALVNRTDDLTRLSNDATVQKYPELTLSGVTQSFFGSPVNFALSAMAGNNYRSAGQKGEIFDLKPLLTLPLDVGGAFRLIPLAEMRGTFWNRRDDLVQDDRQGSRMAYRFGVDATTSVFRDFVRPGKAMEKVRHEIKPELIFAYIPHTEQGNLPDFAEVVEEQNTVTAALTNTLTARMKGKDGSMAYLEILRLKLAQSYDVREARRNADGSAALSRPFGDIDMELDLKPTLYFALYVRNRFNVNDGRWEKANYDVQLSDSRGDAAYVGYRYTRDLLEEVNLSLKASLTKTIALSYDLRKNEFDRRSLDNAFGFNFPRQCWSVGVRYNDAVGDRTILLSFSLNGLGGVGGK